MVKVRENLIGKTFGRLIVLEQAEDYVNPSGHHYARWLCECSCEKHKRILACTYSLKNGDIKSCGCYRREKASEIHKKANQYQLNGEYGIGYTNDGQEFYFDLEDYDKIKEHTWHLDAYGYVVTNDNDIKMHRLVMGVLDNPNIIIDHKNHKLQDNRKSELRECSSQENNMNKAMLDSNTSGVTGVYFDKNRNKWATRIGVNYKTINLGRFVNYDDAVNARKKAEIKYFGEFRFQEDVL